MKYTISYLKEILLRLEGTKWIMASLLYGAGLRLMECLELRVKDLDFSYNQIIVRNGKGYKDRVTMLPTSMKEPLKKHLGMVKVLHDQDLKEGFGICSIYRKSHNSLKYSYLTYQNDIALPG